MTTSDASWSASLRQIGELERQDHWHLRDDDHCYFFGEYSPGKGWAHSRTNQLVLNLKKKPELRTTNQWVHKTRAIADVGRAIAANFKPEMLPGITFVPIPPSKPPEHPDYDDRMLQVARRIAPACDVREVLQTAAARDPRHTSGSKRDPAALRATLRVRPELLAGLGARPIVLLDDVLTTGCSYTVCRDLLAAQLPGASIFGIFVARRIVDRSSAFEDFADLDL
ncbi:MAG: hypothetical protein AB1942_22385 [Pseudomonadota bacterium]